MSGTIKTDIRRLSRDLKHVLRSNEAMSILDLWSVGWTDGGCLVLANALRRWLGTGDILGVWEPVPLGEAIQHHAVLNINGWLIDGDGITTEGGLIRRWKEDLFRHRVELREFDWDTAFEQGMESRRDMESLTMILLDSKFNRYAVLEALQKVA